MPPQPDPGPNYCKRTALARHKWQYRMLRLRNSKPSTYRANFQSSVANDSVLQGDWTAYWDFIAGYLASRGIDIFIYFSDSPDPRDAYQAIVAGGLIPYNVWSGQKWEGMSASQAEQVRGFAKKIRARFEVLFQQWHNVTDAGNIAVPGQGDGGEGGMTNDPVVTD